jgi:hypothetical protein
MAPIRFGRCGYRRAALDAMAPVLLGAARARSVRGRARARASEAGGGCNSCRRRVRVGDQRSGVRQQLVGCGRRDEHEVDLGGFDAGQLERLGAGGRCELREPLAGSGDVAGTDSRPLDDSLVRDADPVADRGVGHDPGRYSRADRRNPRGSGARNDSGPCVDAEVSVVPFRIATSVSRPDARSPARSSVWGIRGSGRAAQRA